MTGDVHLASQGQAACRRGPLDPGPDLRALDAPGPSFQGDGGTANQHAGQTCLLSRQPRAASTARSPRRLSTESWAPGPRQLLRLPPRGGMHPRGPLRWESGPSSGAQGALGMGCRQLPTLVSTTHAHLHTHLCTGTLMCTHNTLTRSHLAMQAHVHTHARSHTLATCTHSTHTSTPSHASHALTHPQWHLAPLPCKTSLPHPESTSPAHKHRPSP